MKRYDVNRNSRERNKLRRKPWWVEDLSSHGAFRSSRSGGGGGNMLKRYGGVRGLVLVERVGPGSE